MVTYFSEDLGVLLYLLGVYAFAAPNDESASPSGVTVPVTASGYNVSVFPGNSILILLDFGVISPYRLF